MRQKLIRTVNLYLPPVLWAAIIFKLSSHPLLQASEIYWKDFIFKKSAHMFFYGVLAILLFRGFRGSGFPKKKAAIWAIILSVLYGVTDEFHQSLVPGREPRIRDIVFDTIGAILATFVIIKKKWEKYL